MEGSYPAAAATMTMGADGNLLPCLLRLNVTMELRSNVRKATKIHENHTFSHSASGFFVHRATPARQSYGIDLFTMMVAVHRDSGVYSQRQHGQPDAGAKCPVGNTPLRLVWG